MTILLPPYSKKHIIALGGLLIAASLVFYVLLMFRNPQEAVGQPDIVTLDSQHLKENFSTSIEQIQQDNPAKAWREKGFILYDIRPTQEYEQKHITGAINAPLSTMKISALANGSHTIIFSDDQAELVDAAVILQEKGFSSIYTLQASIEQLEQQGYKMSMEEGQL